MASVYAGTFSSVRLTWRAVKELGSAQCRRLIEMKKG